MKLAKPLWLSFSVAILFFGCASTYTISENISGTPLVKKTDVKKISGKNGERITETALVSDTLNGQIQYKEIKRYQTKAGTTRQISSEKWKMVDGKWVREGSTPKQPKTY